MVTILHGFAGITTEDCARFADCCVFTLVVFFQAPSQYYGFDIEIDVSPNVLNIQSSGTVLTVHTDIAYGAVAGASVFLNDVPIYYWKSDNRGYFVAKFLMDDIKTLDGLSMDDYNTLTLNGYTGDGEAFIGQQDIKVIDVIPQGK